MQTHTPGHWKDIGNVSGVPDQNGNPDPHGIGCFRGPNQQNDFFQILNYALYRSNVRHDGTLGKTFALGASLIDQYDDATFDPVSVLVVRPQGPITGLNPQAVIWIRTSPATTGTRDSTQVIPQLLSTGTTVITTYSPMAWKKTNETTELTATGLTTIRAIDCPNDLVEEQMVEAALDLRRLRQPRSGEALPTQVINRSFSTVGEFGYGIATSTAILSTI